MRMANGGQKTCLHFEKKWNLCLLAASPRFMTIGQTLTLQIAAKGLSVVITSIGFGRTKSTVRSAFGCGLHPGALSRLPARSALLAAPEVATGDPRP